MWVFIPISIFAILNSNNFLLGDFLKVANNNIMDNKVLKNYNYDPLYKTVFLNLQRKVMQFKKNRKNRKKIDSEIL